MPHTITNPAGLHDPTAFGYSHTATVAGELVLIAGQYASAPDGSVVSTDFAEQVRQAFRNVGVALGAHGLGLSDVVQLRTYVVEHDLETIGVVAGAVRDSWGATPPVHTIVGVAALATPEVRFEVEAVAVRP